MTGSKASKGKVRELAERYRDKSLWLQAAQRLAGLDRIEASPKDIGAIIMEAKAGILRAHEEEIKAELFSWAWPEISKGLVVGLAEWYKERLLSDSLSTKPKSRIA